MAYLSMYEGTEMAGPGRAFHTQNVEAVKKYSHESSAAEVALQQVTHILGLILASGKKDSGIV